MRNPAASIVLLVAMLALAGCESRTGSALFGGAAGAAAGAGGFEYHLNRQKQRVEADLKSGKIDQEEHDIRMDQIRRDSLVQ